VKKEEIEKIVFDQRYKLAVHSAACVQLERAVRDSTWAVSRLLDVRRTNNCSLAHVVYRLRYRRDLAVTCAADTSMNWRQSLFCCCTMSMEQATVPMELKLLR